MTDGGARLNILAMVHLAPPRHCAGAEMMLFSMLRPLADAGHKVDVLLSRPTQDTEPYDFNGVTVHPVNGQRPIDRAIEYVQRSDVIISHLENMPTAVSLARSYGVPFFNVMHNDHEVSRSWAVTDRIGCIVVNSQWMDDAFGNPTNSLIVRPPVFADEYRTRPGSKVTLINLNEKKGGLQFAELAARMPDVDFLGVIGAYGDQIIPDLPNVEIREHGGDMRTVYRSTRVLLIPSEYESWGRVGVEAMCSGIPVIAHPTDGLLESLGNAGTFVDRDDIDGWESAIRELLANGPARRAASALSKARAAELDPTSDLETWVTRVETAGNYHRMTTRRAS